MAVDAINRNEAVSKIKDIMNESAIGAHMKEKHSGEAPLSVAQCHAMIEGAVALA